MKAINDADAMENARQLLVKKFIQHNNTIVPFVRPREPIIAESTTLKTPAFEADVKKSLNQRSVRQNYNKELTD